MWNRLKLRSIPWQSQKKAPQGGGRVEDKRLTGGELLLHDNRHGGVHNAFNLTTGQRSRNINNIIIC